jgi:hypothetical protein
MYSFNPIHLPPQTAKSLLQSIETVPFVATTGCTHFVLRTTCNINRSRRLRIHRRSLLQLDAAGPARITIYLVLLEGPVDGEARLSFAFDIVWVIFLRKSDL